MLLSLFILILCSFILWYAEWEAERRIERAYRDGFIDGAERVLSEEYYRLTGHNDDQQQT